MPHHRNMKSVSGNGDRNPADVPTIDRDRCIACGNCVDFCPGGAVAIIDGKAAVVAPGACTYCTECEAICPVGAIRCPFTVVLLEKDGSTP